MGDGGRKTKENSDHDFGHFAAYVIELFESDNEVEQGVLILWEKLTSDLEGVVPLVVDLEKGHKSDEAQKCYSGSLQSLRQ